MKHGTLELAEFTVMFSSSSAIVTLDEKVLSDVKMIPKVASSL